jgi:hypothetical protein
MSIVFGEPLTSVAGAAAIGCSTLSLPDFLDAWEQELANHKTNKAGAQKSLICLIEINLSNVKNF